MEFEVHVQLKTCDTIWITETCWGSFCDWSRPGSREDQQEGQQKEDQGNCEATAGYGT